MQPWPARNLSADNQCRALLHCPLSSAKGRPSGCNDIVQNPVIHEIKSNRWRPSSILVSAGFLVRCDHYATRAKLEEEGIVTYLIVLSIKPNSDASQLVGALNPVSHKGLPKGWIQTSIYLQVIHSTRHYTTSLFFPQTTAKILSTISEHKTRKKQKHVLEPIYIPRALSTGTCIRQGDLFYFASLHRKRC